MYDRMAVESARTSMDSRKMPRMPIQVRLARAAAGRVSTYATTTQKTYFTPTSQINLISSCSRHIKGGWVKVGWQ